MTALRTLASAALAVVLAAPAALAGDAEGGLLPVPAQPIARGEIVTAAMLTEKHFYYDPARPLDVMTDASDAVGMEARRALPAGKPIPLDAFRPARLVTRGTPTEARFTVGNLSITASVLPQADGGAGDLVPFRNLDSGRTAAGVVAADGTIEVTGQ
jgi:flagellar basal body P-ring formation protein FlgA